jgi:HAD superfamily hydrolase (TIGR01457 family)
MDKQLKNIEIIKKAKCILFDMDGTLFVGDKLIKGAAEIIEYLRERGTPYYFLTNNSSRSRSDYVQKLAVLGLPIPDEKIFSSGEATAIYLQQKHPGAKIFLVGTPSLEKEFLGYGFELTEGDPDYVVLGFDTTLTYEKLSKLCEFVAAGKAYIATHADVVCPTENGFIPDVGSFIALVEAAANRKPDTVIGKPNRPMIDAIVEKTGCSPEEMVMVGDRLYTDIALGKFGVNTVLVLSGETQLEQVANSAFQPDIIFNDVGELLKLIRRDENI